MENYIVSIYFFSFLFYLLSLFLKLKFFSKIALWFLILGFLGNIYLIIQHFLSTHRLPLTDTSETLLSAVTIVVFIFFTLEFGSAFSERKRQLKTMGLWVSLISLLGLISYSWLLKKPVMPLLPALQSKWLVFHVSSCIVAYCLFIISFIAAIIYLVKKYPQAPQGISLSRLYHRCICLGFFLLTLGIILGSIWGKSAWGHWWNWDPKEVWALISWSIYCLYFYGRLWAGWSEKKLSWIAILGFLSCLFTYLGVNFLLKGLHSYA